MPSFSINAVTGVLQTGVFLGFTLYMAALVLTQYAFDWRRMLVAMAIGAVGTAVRQIVVDLLPVAFLINMVFLTMLIVYLCTDARGWRLVITSVEMFLCIMIMDGMLSVICILIPALMPYVDDFLNPLECFIMNILSLACMSIICGVIRLFRRWRGRRNTPELRYWMVFVRLAALVVSLITFLGIVSDVMADEGLLAYNSGYLTMLAVFVPVVAICVFYFIRDLKYLGQIKRNQTLEHQQQVSDALLKNLRHFRHNLINMLYGFEGAILSDDTAQIRAYYRDMAERCMMINNENIVALQHVDSLPLSALLLRHLDEAQEKHIPMYLFCQEHTPIHKRMREPDLVQVVGVLLDNAMEATQEAHVQYVSVELRQVDERCELLIRNTFAPDMDQTYLTGGRSSKPGHQGVGLTSCDAILKRYKKAILNLRVSGQYVETQLLV